MHTTQECVSYTVIYLFSLSLPVPVPHGDDDDPGAHRQGAGVRGTQLLQGRVQGIEGGHDRQGHGCAHCCCQGGPRWSLMGNASRLLIDKDQCLEFDM